MTQPTTDFAIETDALVKHFGSTRAVDGVDLRVTRGSIFGVLGPNGAGKTTTVRMLATLIRPTSGTARVLGYDVVADAHEVRRRISLTGQFASVDEDLTGHENLVLLSRLLGLSRAEARRRAGDLLDVFDLADAASRQVKQFSGGMRRRLDIAASIIRTPDLLFLDEPTTGLDPRSRGDVWKIIRALVDAGSTVLLTTQYLEEADQLADRIAVIDHGRVIAEGTSSELKAAVGLSMLHVWLMDPNQRDQAAQILSELFDTRVLSNSDPHALALRVAEPSRAPTALAALTDAGISIAEFSLGQPSLDEVFLALTGRPAEAENPVDAPEDTPSALIT